MAELRHDLLSVVERMRGLGEKREAIGIRNDKLIHFFDAADDDGLIGRFARGTDDFLVVAVSDQEQGAAFAREFQGFQMNFGYQRAGGVNHTQFAFLRFGAHARRHAVGAEDEDRAYRNFVDGLDENSAAAAQLVHNVAVVHDFVVDVHRIAVGFEGQFDDVHGADNAGAKAAGADTYERFGSVIGAIDLGQTQFVLRKDVHFT